MAALSKKNISYTTIWVLVLGVVFLGYQYAEHTKRIAILESDNQALLENLQKAQAEHASTTNTLSTVINTLQGDLEEISTPASTCFFRYFSSSPSNCWGVLR